MPLTLGIGRFMTLVIHRLHREIIMVIGFFGYARIGEIRCCRVGILEQARFTRRGGEPRKLPIAFVGAGEGHARV